MRRQHLTPPASRPPSPAELEEAESEMGVLGATLPPTPPQQEPDTDPHRYLRPPRLSLTGLATKDDPFPLSPLSPPPSKFSGVTLDRAPDEFLPWPDPARFKKKPHFSSLEALQELTVKPARRPNSRRAIFLRSLNAETTRQLEAIQARATRVSPPPEPPLLHTGGGEGFNFECGWTDPFATGFSAHAAWTVVHKFVQAHLMRGLYIAVPDLRHSAPFFNHGCIFTRPVNADFLCPLGGLRANAGRLHSFLRHHKLAKRYSGNVGVDRTEPWTASILLKETPQPLPQPQAAQPRRLLQRLRPAERSRVEREPVDVPANVRITVRVEGVEASAMPMLTHNDYVNLAIPRIRRYNGGYTPNTVYVIHNVLIAKKVSVAAAVEGAYQDSFTLHDHVIGFTLLRYRGLRLRHFLDCPDAELTGDSCPYDIADPSLTTWPRPHKHHKLFDKWDEASFMRPSPASSPGPDSAIPRPRRSRSPSCPSPLQPPPGQPRDAQEQPCNLDAEAAASTDAPSLTHSPSPSISNHPLFSLHFS